MSDYYDRVHENAKELLFYTEIGKSPIKVKLDVGWVWIEEDLGHTGTFGFFGKRVKKVTTFTTKDAKKLAECINALVKE